MIRGVGIFQRESDGYSSTFDFDIRSSSGGQCEASQVHGCSTPRHTAQTSCRRKLNGASCFNVESFDQVPVVRVSSSGTVERTASTSDCVCRRRFQYIWRVGPLPDSNEVFQRAADGASFFKVAQHRHARFQVVRGLPVESDGRVSQRRLSFEIDRMAFMPAARERCTA